MALLMTQGYIPHFSKFDRDLAEGLQAGKLFFL
jgi:hypothetical protein